MVYRACQRTCRGRLGPDRQVGSLGFAAKHSMAVSLPCWGRLEQAGQLAGRNPMQLRRRSSPPDAALRTLCAGEPAATPTSVSLRDWAIVTPRLPAEAAEAADRHLYFS